MAFQKNKQLLLFFFIFCTVTLAKQRPSSYPFITGDTFRAFCDHMYDETTTALPTHEIKYGQTIFVKGDMLKQFFTHKHPHIKTNYILVTHNSANSVPGIFGNFLDDPKILAWFGQNIDRNHPKLHAIPLGIENGHWPRGDITVYETLKKKLPLQKNKMLYLNVNVKTNPKERKPIIDFFKNSPFCYSSKNKTHKEFLEDLATSFFVASPKGKGVDCHRTWETLYCGSIPIVTHSSIDPLFAYLPVLIIDTWQQITQDYLENMYIKMMDQSYRMEMLYADYWFEKIKSYIN